MAPIQAAAAQVGFAEEKTITKNLSSKNPSVRYWAAIALAQLDNISIESKRELQKRLHDPSPAVRIESANTLARHGDLNAAVLALIKDLAHENLIIVTHAARTIELLGEQAIAAKTPMEAALIRAEKIRPADLSPVIVLPGDRDLAMFVAFSCRAFLEKLEK